MNEHTPTPWENYGSLIVHFGEGGAPIALMAGRESTSTSTAKPIEISDKQWKKAMTDAAFIVEACNHYEALVDALRSIANANTEDHNDPAWEKVNNVLDKLQKG